MEGGTWHCPEDTLGFPSRVSLGQLVPHVACGNLVSLNIYLS